DEGLANQGRIEPDRAPGAQEVGLANARLGDGQAVVWNLRAQSTAALGVDLEAPEVAVVDPDQPRAAGERALELSFVVCFDQRFEADVPGKVDQPGKATRRMENRQQQDDIGPGRAQQRQLTSI